MSYFNNSFSLTLYVDSKGADNSFTTVASACNHAATLTRSISQQIRIEVNSGTYFESPFVIPSFTTVTGRGADTNYPLTRIIILVDEDDTYGIELTSYSALKSIYLQLQSAPAPPIFLNDFSLIQGSTAIPAYSFVDNCLLTIVTTNQTNDVYYINAVGSKNTSLTYISNVRVIGEVNTGYIFKSNNASIIHNCAFRLSVNASNDGIFDLDHTNLVTYIRNTTLYQTDGYISPIDINATLTTKVELSNTRIRYPNISGGILTSDITNSHPTPRQLSIARKMASKTVNTTYQMDAFLDGTIRADTSGGTFIITLPPLSNVEVGEVFAVKLIDSTSVTIEGSGAELIDGSLNAVLSTLNDSYSFQANDSGSWDII